MRLYVASKWEERPRVREVMQLLRDYGHTITFDWTSSEELSIEQAEHDKQGVLTADALVFVAEKDLPYKGAYVEFGMAVALGIPIYVMGRAIDACIFTRLPEVRYGIADLLHPVTVHG